MSYAIKVGYNQKDADYPFIAQAYIKAVYNEDEFKMIYMLNLKMMPILNSIS